MAILSKIRERSLFLIVIIGLALFAFVLDPSKIFNSSKVEEIGEINGEVISRQEFASTLDAYKQRLGNRTTEMKAANAVWERLIRHKIYKTQLEEAGITIGEEDIWIEIINSDPVKNNPQFSNEAGLFDEDKFKQFLKDTQENNPELWQAWTTYMNGFRDNIIRRTYDNLITSGLGTSLKEGERKYLNENTKIDAKYIYVPYSSVDNKLVTVTDDEIKAYIKSHPNEFKVDNTRDISYVKFEIKPTTEDENILKQEVAKLIDDKKEYNKVTKGEIIIKGFKNATNLQEFFSENESDLPLKDHFLFKKDISNQIKDAVFNGKKGDIIGPYIEKGYVNLAKIVSFTKLPDSVKARHILIAYSGSRAAKPETILTEKGAKKIADSLVNVLKRNKSKFASIAKKMSDDKSNADKGGDIGWFTYNRMVPEFRDFVFSNNKGTIGIVKTTYGYHVVEIQDQKNYQQAVKLAIFGKQITPSEKTENNVFQEVESFSLEVSKEGKFFDVARNKKYKLNPITGLKVLDEDIPGLGSQRQIVIWAFNKDTNVGDFKRFDIDNGYIVAFLSAKIKKGLMSSKRASFNVKPILVNQKKAEILKKKFNGETLEDIKNSTGDIIRVINGITFKSPVISGVGSEPKVVGAMLFAKKDKVYKGIEGEKGVFAFKVIKKELPTKMPNYDFVRKQISSQRRNSTVKIYEAIKKASEIKDNRAAYYGIQ